MCCEALRVGLEALVDNPPVEPDQLWLVAVDQLDAAGQPILQKRLVGLLGRVDHCPIRWLGLRWAIQGVVARVVDIAVEQAPTVEKEPMLGAVARHPKNHPVCPDSRGQFADDVALGAHGHGVPRVQCRVVHRKAVVVLCHGHHKARTRRRKQLCPGSCVELLGTKQGDEIFVAECRLWTVCRDVMFVFAAPLYVHIARVPLTTKCRHGVWSPMDENPELAVPIPLRYADALQRFPCRAVRLFGMLHVSLRSNPSPQPRSVLLHRVRWRPVLRRRDRCCLRPLQARDRVHPGESTVRWLL